jgi:hypothetical protein
MASVQQSTECVTGFAQLSQRFRIVRGRANLDVGCGGGATHGRRGRRADARLGGYNPVMHRLLTRPRTTLVAALGALAIAAALPLAATSASSADIIKAQVRGVGTASAKSETISSLSVRGLPLRTTVVFRCVSKCSHRERHVGGGTVSGFRHVAVPRGAVIDIQATHAGFTGFDDRLTIKPAAKTFFSEQKKCIPVNGGIPRARCATARRTVPYAETSGDATKTWSDYLSVGDEGTALPAGFEVQVTCRIEGRSAGGGTWWYRIHSGPWYDTYYAPAGAFYNDGRTSGSLSSSPPVDKKIPNC